MMMIIIITITKCYWPIGVIFLYNTFSTDMLTARTVGPQSIMALTFPHPKIIFILSVFSSVDSVFQLEAQLLELLI